VVSLSIALYSVSAVYKKGIGLNDLTAKAVAEDESRLKMADAE
jgi:hypothetical protein